LRPWKDFKKPETGLLHSAYSDATVYMFISFDNPNQKESLQTFIDEFPQAQVFGKGEFEQDITLNGFNGKQYRNKNFSIVQFYQTKNHVYIVGVGGDDLSKPSVNQFFNSIKLDGTKGKDVPDEDSYTNFPVIVLPPSESANYVESQSTAQDKVFKPSEVTRKARILIRPQPIYTEEARQRNISGTVVLRAVFSLNGKLKGVRVLGGLPYGLTQQAIKAANNIRFIPAMKDGRFVSQAIQIEYNFNLY
jgi:TonB family protein